MSIDLSGKVVLITGASTGIGRETALRFAAAGSLLALTYFEHRDEIEEVAELCRTLGSPDVLTVSLQLADDDSIRTLVEAVIAHFAAVDVLVHNAGVIDWRRFLDQDFAAIEVQLAVNLEGTMKLTWVFLPMVRDTMIAIGSTATLHDSRTPPTYCATKWGLRGFFKALALERPGKRFVLVHPTGTATRMNEMQGMPPERVADVVVRIAAGDIPVPSGGDVDMRDYIEG
jgi:NAD(P)-dependent dehydrogenase (short-subunit alcohol dehydrogenase family)